MQGLGVNSSKHTNIYGSFRSYQPTAMVDIAYCLDWVMTTMGVKNTAFSGAEALVVVALQQLLLPIANNLKVIMLSSIASRLDLRHCLVPAAVHDELFCQSAKIAIIVHGKDRS